MAVLPHLIVQHLCRHYEEHRPNQDKVIGGMEMGGRRARRAPQRFEFPDAGRPAAADATLDAMLETSGAVCETQEDAEAGRTDGSSLWQDASCTYAIASRPLSGDGPAC